MKKIVLSLFAAIVAALMLSAAPASAEQADEIRAQVTCYGDYCSGQDPETTGCSAGAYTVTSVGYNGGTLEVRWSPTCQTNWARINVGWSGYFRIQQQGGYDQHYSGTNGTFWWTKMIYSPVLGCRANAGNTYTAYV